MTVYKRWIFFIDKFCTTKNFCGRENGRQSISISILYYSESRIFLNGFIYVKDTYGQVLALGIPFTVTAYVFKNHEQCKC